MLVVLTVILGQYCLTKPEKIDNLKAATALLAGVVTFLFFCIVRFFSVLKLPTAEHATELENLFGKGDLMVFIIIFGLALLLFKMMKSYREHLATQRRFIEIGRYKFMRDNRMLLILTAWTTTVTLTFVFASLRHFNTITFSDSFYSSWMVDLIFFSLLGVAVAFASLQSGRDEDFAARVGTLFAATSPNEALSYIQKRVRKLGYAVDYTERVLTIEKYDPNLPGYMFRMAVKTELKNLFGDVEASDTNNFGYIPGDFSGCPSPPDVIGKMTSFKVKIGDRQEEERISNPIELHSGMGQVSRTFKVEEDKPTIVTMELWSWCLVGEEMFTTPARFTQSVRTTIRNRIDNRDDALYFSSQLIDVRENDPPDETFVELTYGKDITLRELMNIAPPERHHYMTWRNKEAFETHREQKHLEMIAARTQPMDVAEEVRQQEEAVQGLGVSSET